MCSIEIKDDDALVRNASSRLSLDGVVVVVVAVDIEQRKQQASSCDGLSYNSTAR